MKPLRLALNWIMQGFYNWAMREINPLHHDVPRIMKRQVELKDEERRLLSC